MNENKFNKNDNIISIKECKDKKEQEERNKSIESLRKQADKLGWK